jgi:ABC-type cobalamin/Fe3+-siderophores transport system ATPase subunit
MLRTENLSVHTPQGQLLHSSLNLHFKPGTITAITGPNGSGKSTLLAHLSGIRRPESGHIWLDNENLARLSPKARALQVASIGQYDTCPADTLVSRRIAHGLPTASREEILNIANAMGIAHLLGKHLGALSGGERRRAFIARCLINSRANLYVLDEPNIGLDHAGLELLHRKLKQLANLGKAIIFSTHSPLTNPAGTVEYKLLC